MARAPSPHRRPRRWRLRDLRRAGLARGLLLVAALFMLGLQTALAAYGCTMPPATMAPIMAMGAADAAAHGACPQLRHAADDGASCARHDAAPTSVPNDTRPATVPRNLLAALVPALPLAIPRAPATSIPGRRYRLRAPPPPLPLLFCSLLI